MTYLICHEIILSKKQQLKEYSFNSFLLMERFQLKLLVKMAELDQKLSEQLGIALAANPAMWLEMIMNRSSQRFSVW